MSNFHMARDRETGKIVGLKVLDKEKTEALEARFKGFEKPTEGEIAVIVQASANRRTRIRTASRPTTSSLW